VVAVHYELLEDCETFSFDYSLGHVRYNIYDSVLDNSENTFHVTTVPAVVSLEKQDSDVDYAQLVLFIGVEIVADFLRDVIHFLHFGRSTYQLLRWEVVG
jgi:hypothetical protein